MHLNKNSSKYHKCEEDPTDIDFGTPLIIEKPGFPRALSNLKRDETTSPVKSDGLLLKLGQAFLVKYGNPNKPLDAEQSTGRFMRQINVMRNELGGKGSAVSVLFVTKIIPDLLNTFDKLIQLQGREGESYANRCNFNTSLVRGATLQYFID